MVIYSSDKYDLWDLLISLMGIGFSSAYLYQKVFFDLASKALGSLVLSCSLFILYKSILSITDLPSVEFTLIILGTAIISIIAGKLPHV